MTREQVQRFSNGFLEGVQDVHANDEGPLLAGGRYELLLSAVRDRAPRVRLLPPGNRAINASKPRFFNREPVAGL